MSKGNSRREPGLTKPLSTVTERGLDFRLVCGPTESNNLTRPDLDSRYHRDDQESTHRDLFLESVGLGVKGDETLPPIVDGTEGILVYSTPTLLPVL